MAILWSESIDGNLYEVRSHGASLRLYRNGVHHSQFNPQRPLAGGIWDLLNLPALYRDPADIQSALVLGFGAGAGSRCLQELADPDRLVGIELDPIHLSIADSFFDCSRGCELLAADAVAWVESAAESEAASFDWILDDLFGESEGIPVRGGPFDAAWFQRLARLLRPDGMLVINLVEPEEVSRLPILTRRDLRRRFPCVLQFSLEAYDNRVIACSARSFDEDRFADRLSEVYQRFPRCRGVDRRYQIVQL